MLFQLPIVDSVTHPANQPKLVVILSYQRCGSTFLGQLFNLNPEAFYQFEPLDSLYSSIYGTTFGWNVPSDINTCSNGSRRWAAFCDGLLESIDLSILCNLLFHLLLLYDLSTWLFLGIQAA